MRRAHFPTDAGLKLHDVLWPVECGQQRTLVPSLALRRPCVFSFTPLAGIYFHFKRTHASESGQLTEERCGRPASSTAYSQGSPAQPKFCTLANAKYMLTACTGYGGGFVWHSQMIDECIPNTFSPHEYTFAASTWINRQNMLTPSPISLVPSPVPSAFSRQQVIWLLIA